MFNDRKGKLPILDMDVVSPHPDWNNWTICYGNGVSFFLTEWGLPHNETNAQPIFNNFTFSAIDLVDRNGAHLNLSSPGHDYWNMTENDIPNGRVIAISEPVDATTVKLYSPFGKRIV
jgi:hypothetical protein